MTQRNITVSLLLAGLLAAGGAVQAQSGTAAGTSPLGSPAAGTIVQGGAAAGTSAQGGTSVLGNSAATGGTAASTSDVPAKAGEASTTTSGKPNAVTTNQSVTGQAGMGQGRDQVRMDAQGRGGASATNSVPSTAGEASTMVNGRPNANPDSPTLNKSKAEIRSEKEMKKAERKSRREAAVMGQKGAQAGAPAGTPAVAPAGTPSVFKGGTPQ